MASLHTQSSSFGRVGAVVSSDDAWPLKRAKSASLGNATSADRRSGWVSVWVVAVVTLVALGAWGALTAGLIS